jgi:hypothetical protein
MDQGSQDEPVPRVVSDGVETVRLPSLATHVLLAFWARHAVGGLETAERYLTLLRATDRYNGTAAAAVRRAAELASEALRELRDAGVAQLGDARGWP